MGLVLQKEEHPQHSEDQGRDFRNCICLDLDINELLFRVEILRIK